VPLLWRTQGDPAQAQPVLLLAAVSAVAAIVGLIRM